MCWKLWILLQLSFMLVMRTQAGLSEDMYTKTVPQLISAAGYPIEKHRVRTEDGYIIQMHRIPAGRRVPRRSEGSNEKGKKAVLVMHGLLGSSGDFVIMGPERSLAYLLADAGYDVWLGNLRGNSYTSHESLLRNDPKFWEYSFHEHGLYDAPAMIDKILNVTKLSKVLYLGYSMGTTTFFTMMSERPEYNDRVVAFVGLAPAVYLDNMKLIATIFLKTFDLPKMMRDRGLISIEMPPAVRFFLLSFVCSNKRNNICMDLIYKIVGEDYEQSDLDMNLVMIARAQPASFRQLQHFGKIAMTGEFTAWEDGLDGAIRPYNLTNVQVPVSLLYGNNDMLTEKSQIIKLAVTMDNNGMLESARPGCQWPKFNHLDFIIAKDIGKLLNRPLVNHVDELFEKYNNV